MMKQGYMDLDEYIVASEPHKRNRGDTKQVEL